MKTKIIEVRDQDGVPAEAELMICDKCDGDKWVMYFLWGTHNHAQCAACGTVFCDGRCKHS